MFEAGLLPAEVVEGASVDIELSEVEVDRPEFVLTTFPFPSKTIPLPSSQHPGKLSQQKLPSSQISTRGRNPVPVAATHSG